MLGARNWLKGIYGLTGLGLFAGGLHGQTEADLLTVLSGQIQDTTYTISMIPQLGTEVVFDPVTVVTETVRVYDQYDDTPHQTIETQHSFTCEDGVVSGVRLLNPGTSLAGYWIQFTHTVSGSEIRDYSYDFEHLDWTEEEITAYLAEREKYNTLGRVTIDYDPYTTTSAVITYHSGDRYWVNGRTSDGDTNLLSCTLIRVPTFFEEPIRVDTTRDEDDDNYSENNQSLREALKRAAQRTGPLTIPVEVSGTIHISAEKGPLQMPAGNPGPVTILVPEANLTLDGDRETCILEVVAGQQMVLMGLTFQKGWTETGGGGAILNHGNLEILASLFRGNSVGEESDSGGGAIANKGTLRITGSRLEVNINAGKAGGGAILNHGDLFAEDCLFFYNVSTRTGGAVGAVAGSNTTLNRCFFDYNYGYHSGSQMNLNAEISCQGSLDAYNCIFAGLGTQARGTGTYRHCTFITLGNRPNVAAGPGNIILSHCMLGTHDGGVSSPSISRLDSGIWSVQSEGHNLIAKLPGADVFSPAPTDLTDTIPVVYYKPGEVFSLLAYSPGVNQGNPELSIGGYPVDMDRDAVGNTRRADTIDIGAIEVGYERLAVLEALLNAENGDENENGIPDAIDVMGGIDPYKNEQAKPPLQTVSAAEAPPAAVARTLFMPAEAASRGPGDSTAVVELRLDERADFMEGTLQYSANRLDWTDLATYRPLGIGEGYERTAVAGGDPADHSQAGYGWFIREEIPYTGEACFYRLLARIIEDAPDTR